MPKGGKKRNYRTFSCGVNNINLANASGDSAGIDRDKFIMSLVLGRPPGLDFRLELLFSFNSRDLCTKISVFR